MKFAQKCTQSEKTEKMFPLKKNNHDMEVRNPEKFIVKHANTERLKNSAIPNMQRMLNGSILIKRKPG